MKGARLFWFRSRDRKRSRRFADTNQIRDVRAWREEIRVGSRGATRENAEAGEQTIEDAERFGWMVGNRGRALGKNSGFHATGSLRCASESNEEEFSSFAQRTFCVGAVR